MNALMAVEQIACVALVRTQLDVERMITLVAKQNIDFRFAGSMRFVLVHGVLFLFSYKRNDKIDMGC
jgi:hypothetical protein